MFIFFDFACNYPFQWILHNPNPNDEPGPGFSNPSKIPNLSDGPSLTDGPSPSER